MRFKKRSWRLAGLEVSVKKYPAFETFEYYLKKLQIGTILDVGANEGQFACEVRANGFSGRILSFEPSSKVFPQLEARAQLDRNWQCFNYALGGSEGSAELRV